MSVSIIAAISKNGYIGKDNQLLWHIPLDFKYFKETTIGHSVFMGRKTFLSIGKPLPNRRNVVITRDTTFTSEGVEVCHSIDEAITLLTQHNEEVFCLGGADIYSQTLPLADKLYITHVDVTIEGDAMFPEINPDQWHKISSKKHSEEETGSYPIEFAVYTRIQD
jgi:dihydrofolate reductase